MIVEILKKYRPIWALDHALALMDWDIETHMPRLGAGPRGFSQAQLSLIKQQRYRELMPSVTKAGTQADLTDQERGILRVISRDANYFLKVPESLIEDLQQTTTKATVVWREARKKSDYSLFEPHLEKIIALKRQEADLLGYEKNPYDAHLNLFEEGLTCEDIERVFSSLVDELRTLLNKITSAESFPHLHELESVKYQQSAMANVNLETLRLLNMPSDSFRTDVSVHPFTSGIAIGDVRITTRYEGRDFRESLFSLIHECGHALYELQLDPSMEYTPLGHLTSLGVHESQSRFWENSIGRSREFVKLIYPILTKNLSFVSRFKDDEVYKYFNVVRPSPIRVAADEVTYNLHIALRYEIEKRLILTELEVAEIPSAWNELMEKFVGVTPENDSMGVLQDIHWSNGYFGYFPTYTLGNIVAGMLYPKLSEELNLSRTISNGDFSKVKEWLRQNIHRYGATYSPKELLKRTFGREYDTQPLLRYLEDKYLV